MLTQNKKAFTLVELIIVITILAILATIGFMSYQTYTIDARDGKRVTDLGEIRNGLSIYQAKNSVLPAPDAQVTTIKNGSLVLEYQGYAGTNLLNKLRSSEMKDPKDNIAYTYSTNGDYTKFQLMSLLEKGDTLNLSINPVNTTYAANNYVGRKTYVVGNKLGLFLDNITNTPIQESLSGILDLSLTGTTFKVVFANTSANSGTIVGSGVNLYNNVLSIANTIPQTITSKLNVLDFFGDNSGKALYRFENNANDEGNFYNGIASNLSYAAGKFGTGGNFNGLTTTISATTSFNSSDNWTLSFFAKSSLNDTNIHSVFMIGTGGGGYCDFGIFQYGGKFYLISRGAASNWDPLYSSNGIKVNGIGYLGIQYSNTYSHYLISFNGISYVTYKDGILVGTYTPPTYTSTTKTINIGSLTSGGTYYFDGIMDQVRVFNRALTSTEVTQLYNEQ